MSSHLISALSVNVQSVCFSLVFSLLLSSFFGFDLSSLLFLSQLFSCHLIFSYLCISLISILVSTPLAIFVISSVLFSHLSYLLSYLFVSVWSPFICSILLITSHLTCFFALLFIINFLLFCLCMSVLLSSHHLPNSFPLLMWNLVSSFLLFTLHHFFLIMTICSRLFLSVFVYYLVSSIIVLS